MNESKLKRRIFRLTVNALFAGFLSGATAMLWFVKVIDSTDNINSFLNVLRQQSDLQYAFALACLTIAVYFGSGGGGGSISGGTKANVLPDPVSA